MRAALSSLGPPRPSERELIDGPARPGRPSAVLVPLYDDEDGLACVVLTRRTWGLRTHQGEVSFPGGRVEPGEAPGGRRLPGGARRRSGSTPPPSRSSASSTTWPRCRAGRSSPRSWACCPAGPRPTPNPHEVEAVLHVPLAELADPDIFREEVWTFPDGRVQPITFFELVGDTVWGATAALLRQLLGMATGTLGRGRPRPPLGKRVRSVSAHAQ